MTKKTKETNLEHHKDALKKLFGENFYRPEYMCGKIKEELDRNIELQEIECFTDKFLDWMLEPYEEPILNEIEKEYLRAAIKPFRKRVKNIMKTNGSDHEEYIYISVATKYGACNDVSLPNFPHNTLFKGMELNREYTLKRLGLL